VHEERKALYDKKKEVYGPKPVPGSDEPAPDQTSAEEKQKKQSEVKGSTAVKSKKSGKNKTHATTAKKGIPPPSKELQALKNKRNAAKKAVPAKATEAPDVAGTVMPLGKADVAGTLVPGAQP
jgi:hypothetical protein